MAIQGVSYETESTRQAAKPSARLALAVSFSSDGNVIVAFFSKANVGRTWKFMRFPTC